MIRIENKADCCGCESCVQICPKKCISFEQDHEGFNYPNINIQNCIKCSLCVKVCPVINQDTKRDPLKVYAAKNYDEKIRIVSSSGGIFTLIAENIIADGGVAFGAKFNNKWEVIHDYTETINGLDVFRGSKYVQSRIGESYLSVKKFLHNGQKVLFTGTPCQIAGLRKFLQKDYDNLILVDFICHGVPSPGIWQQYLDILNCSGDSDDKKKILALSIDNAHVIDNIFFRDKTNGWKKFGLTISKQSAFVGTQNIVSQSEVTHTSQFLVNQYHRDNIYMKGFLDDLYLRPSCHACPAKSSKSGSDITIADFWRVHNILPEYDDDKGVSLVVINSSIGQTIYDNISCDSIEVCEDVMKSNFSFHQSSKPHRCRNAFFKRLTHSNKPISHLIKKYTKPPFKSQIKYYVKTLVKRLILVDKKN